MHTAVPCIPNWVGRRLSRTPKYTSTSGLLPVQKKHVEITYNFDKKVEHDKKPSRIKSLGLKLLKYQKA
jgi:hypothetical protein